MGKISKDALKTGAQKASKVISLVALATSLAIVNPTTAAAYVEPENIIGEAQTTEDRKYTKEFEGNSIDEYFTGTDYNGNLFVTTEEIAKAIVMSDQLNSFCNYESYPYDNTTISEVYNLDINRMYDDLLAGEADGFYSFGVENMENKPAIEAYLNFSCGTVVEKMKRQIQAAVDNELYNSGLNVTNYSVVRIVGDRAYAIARVDGYPQLIKLSGDSVDLLVALNHRYEVCKNNISGRSNMYLDTFAYTGIDINTGESTWLALGDDELKDMLNRGLACEREMGYDLQATLGEDCFFVWEDQDVKDMRALGFTEEEIANATRRDASLEMPMNLVK